ncbi:isoleucine--tRNA ligase [Veillonella sp. CHU110]|uniref:isoleucine--tRNA ligase n=1 Tax=Veillonella sp. CHU110 TaxID=2490947 RepID=UPI000F8CE211|nr:isoleucine--tRNA ligase [Veillonella sp. CHU110]
MDYGKTLHLPETEFPMRGNLPKREPEFIKFWEDNKIYEKRLAKNKGKKSFILHDGPPYANGKLHIGHALNKTLKDIVMKYKTMQGHYTPYIPGWDTHGLPIEHAVIKNTGLNRHEMSPLDLRNKCSEYALNCVEEQKKDFIRFGVLGEWDRPYLTLRPEFEVKQIGVFGEMAKRGYIYKGLKTVYWCTHCETALAEAEIEYAEKKSFSIYVKFAYVNGAESTLPAGFDTSKLFSVIWTTTPWTMPANQAISVNPELDYSWVKIGDEAWLLANGLIETATKEMGVESYEVLNTFKGNELELANFKHPFADRNAPILLGSHVTLDAGTGCVHTAPAHGEDDFNVVKAYKDAGKIDFDILSLVDATGRYIAKVDKPRYGDTEQPLAGVEIHDAEVPVIKILAHNGALVQKGNIRHQYAHCWRCKNPVIYRATEQWFSSVDGYRQEALKAIDEQVQWIPKWGHDRIYNMIADRGDWVISRQRAWGVPIPIYYCDHCGEHIINDDTISSLQEWFAKEGSNAWWAHEAKELLPAGFTCPSCGHDSFHKETDIMDVWFDSGSSWSGVLEQNGMDVPCAMYLEGSDQHRGWFNSSLLTGIATRGHAPYNAVLTHGFVVDGEGRKMSKSVGNTVAPSDIIDVHGADVMRLWVSSADYQADVRLSKDIVKQLAEVYRKIRNTFRFLLGNLDNFNPNTDKVAYKDLTELDRWALYRLEEVRQKVTNAYENYEFHILYHTIHNFCTVDLSSFYLDVLKDTMYAEKEDNVARRSAQTAIYEILTTLVKMVSPVLSFTAEEVWQYMPKEEGMEESVMLADWPQGHADHVDAELSARWATMLALRSEMTKALEGARRDKAIGHSLDASITVYADGDAYQALTGFGGSLASLLIVSEAHVVEGRDNAPANAVTVEDGVLSIVVTPSELEKCERCWIHRDTVGQDTDHPTLCARCADVVKG